MISIYLLERDSIPFYIGKTKNLKSREIDHKTKFGKNITLIPIDLVKEDEWIFWEIYWINQFKQWGFKLENKNNGGNGPETCSYITKSKISKSNKESWNYDRKIKMSELHLGKIKNNKIVSQFNKDGTFIKNWVSVTQVSKELGFSISNISSCCCGKTLSAYGYIWRYKNQFIEIMPILEPVTKSSLGKVIQKDLNNNVIKIWDSARKAAIGLNINYNAINNCLKGNTKTSGNFIWKYI